MPTTTTPSLDSFFYPHTHLERERERERQWERESQADRLKWD